MRPFSKLIILLVVLSLSIAVFVSDALAWVSVQVKPEYVLADGKKKATVTAIVRRADGGSNSGLKVDFYIVYPNDTFGSLKPLSATTNSAGKAKTVYSQPSTPAPSTVGIAATVTVNVDGVTQTYTGYGWVYLVFVKIYPSSTTVEDGNSAGPFEVVVLPNEVTETSRQWTWGAPTGAGNNPYCQFSTTTEEITTIQGQHQAKWFAYPDRPFTSLRSTYTLNCEIVVEGLKFNAIKSKLTVEIPKIGGGTAPPTISGEPGYVYDKARRLWGVRGIGTLSRTGAQKDIALGSNSQFFKKLTVHEDKHVEDLNNGFNGHHFWTIEEYFMIIRRLTNPTEQGLKDAAKKALDDYKLQELIEATELESEMDRRAYKLSDPIPPFYIYQRHVD